MRPAPVAGIHRAGHARGAGGIAGGMSSAAGLFTAGILLLISFLGACLPSSCSAKTTCGPGGAPQGPGEVYRVPVEVPDIFPPATTVLPSPTHSRAEARGLEIQFYPPEIDPLRALAVISIGAMMTGMDAGLYETINKDMAPPLVREITRRAGYLGDGSSTLGICLALSARDPGTARLGARAVIYSSLLTGMIKFSLGRARPVRGLGPAHYAGPFALSPGFDSMPSGHSAAAFALAGVLARQYPKYRRWFWGLAGLAAISRVYQGAHWPSDVFVGSAIGILAAETAMRGGVTYENAACEHFGSLVEGQALTSNLPCDSMKLIE